VPSSKPVPAENRLIAALPRKSRQHLLAGCDEVELALADPLYAPGERMRHVYFPTDSFISLVAPVNGHASLEVGMIGNEGMLGSPLLLGVDVSSLHAVVQGAGPAWQMSAALFCSELSHSPALHRRLNRYVYVLMAQLAASATCIRFHVVEERLARWLLMSHDRAHSDEFHVTHESLGYMLGVRRVGITKAAGELQKRKLISYTRGDVTILDRGGLEAVCCGCYETDKKTYDHMFG
jgi:CRP-like cAMP-binding protein